MLRRLSRKGSTSTQGGKNDALVKFLEFIDSSIWALPIATFIEHRSVAFDRQQADVSLFENIHKEFRELVDTLVECFCADTNIPLEQLRAELKSAKADQLTLHQKTSLEPVAAAQDFNVFVPMMMRKNVELQLQALQMIEFMCGLIPSVLQIEEGESFKNKAKIISPEETERYVLIAVMRQSKEEFDNLSRREMEELEEVLRSSEEERRRLEEERAREQAIMSKALAITDGAQASDGQKRPDDTAVCATGIEIQQRSEPSEEVEKAITKASRDISEVKIQRTPSAKKKRGSISERPPSPKISAPVEKERNENAGPKSPSVKTADETQNADRPSTKKEGRPPTTKRPSSKERRASLGATKERRPSTEARKRKDESKTGKKTANGEEDEGLWQGPRTKNVYDVNALLQEPSRLNSAQLRSRAEYLRMQRDRLLALKASEREKQMNEVSQRAAQERPRTAKAARGLMRGSRGGIDHDDVLAARREIVEKLKTEIDGKADDA
ncbi:unnamed protein product [Cylicocyclus nassatus]|uniref:Cilia- and flagella-associated protein 36 n=1 Tax=Cylicocyclus nassatus TaxID=53992 RepID=A0AA36DL00_CYLNA|nr:unnamed protein product [Cylicocyclus nassatus]